MRGCVAPLRWDLWREEMEETPSLSRTRGTSPHLCWRLRCGDRSGPPCPGALAARSAWLSFRNSPGSAGADQASRMSAIRRAGVAVKVWSMFQPCFLAVERTERMTAKSFAPFSERKPPEIFCRSFIMRPSCSARLLVKGTVGSVRKRSTSCLRVLRRSRRLWPTRRGGRPRRRAFASAGCASWNARPSATTAS